MKQDVIDKVVAQFKTVFPNVTVPPIKWNPNMRTTAGKVRIKNRQAWLIELNPNLLIDDLKLEHTLLHELCHVADLVVYNKVGHGRTWKHCMQKLGQRPDRCHQFDTTGIKRRHKKVAAMQCSCHTIEITNLLLKKIQRGIVYRCRTCRQPMKLVSQTGTGEATQTDTLKNSGISA